MTRHIKETDEPYVQIQVHVPRNTADALRARAWVHKFGGLYGVSTLCRDVIEGWLATTSDWSEPHFHFPMEIAPVPMPKERYAGYLRALGFVD